MSWTQVKPYADSETLYWVSGIYKVVSFDGIHFHAYYIRDDYKNWGDNPSQPPCHEYGYHSRFWPSLVTAQDACEVHSIAYVPRPKTVVRAQDLLAGFIAESELAA